MASKTITLTLTESQIRAIDADRSILAGIINKGKCSKFLDDNDGLSAIDLHGLMVTLRNACEVSKEITSKPLGTAGKGSNPECPADPRKIFEARRADNNALVDYFRSTNLRSARRWFRRNNPIFANVRIKICGGV